MKSSTSRPPLNLAVAVLLGALQCGPIAAGAGVPHVESDGRPVELGAPLRPQDKVGRPSRAERFADRDHRQPISSACGAITVLWAGDGPAHILCDALSVELASPDGLMLDVQKSSSTTEVTGPGPVNYEYFLFNPNFVPLTGIVVIDDHVDAPPFCPFTNLPPMTTGVCTATYTVTPSDLQAGGSPVAGSGFLRNIATVLTTEGISETTSLFIPFNLPGNPLMLLPASPSLGVAVQGRSQQFTFSAVGGMPPYEFAGTGAPPGMAFQQTANGLVLGGAPQVTGDFSIGVAVADSATLPSIVERNYTLRVVSELTLMPPGQALPDAVANQAYEFFFTISGGQAPYGFSGEGLPQGLNLAIVGNQLRLGGTSTQSGDFTINVAVSDSATPSQFVSESYALRVAQDLHLAPAEPVLPDAVAGRAYSFTLTIEGGTPPFEFTAGGAPPGLEFELLERQLTLSGTTDQTGDFMIEIAVSDSSGSPQSVSQTYSLRVVPELRLLPLDPVLPEARVGENYSLSFTTQGGFAPVSLNGDGAPPGLQFEVLDAQLVLSGTPTEIGDYPIAISAQDSAAPQQQIAREYMLGVVLRLEIEPESLPEATVGEDYLAVLSVRNGFPPYEFDVTGLPSGLGVSSNAISGRPGQSGAFPLTAFASDAHGNSGSIDYQLSVRTTNEVSIGGRLPDAHLDSAYGFQLQAFGAPSPLTWSGTAGLPAGLGLVSTGLLNGNPQQTGSFSFSATATSADGSTNTGDFDIEVLPPDPLNAEPSYPPGLIGVPYRSPTAVRGGQAPYSCAITAGSLPPGLALAGCNEGIAGTPTEPGSFPFSIGVMDSSAPELVGQFTGVIQVAESTPIADPQPPDLAYQAPYRIPAPELSVERPDPALPDESLQGLAVDAWGNRYVVGYSYNGSDYDIRVLKYSPRGELLWDQKFDSGSHDYGYGITVEETGQAVYASGYSLNGNRFEAVLVRYDLVGVEQWVRRNGASSPVVAYYGLAADENGVYAVGERYNGANFDALVVHYSHAGNLEWQTVRPSQATRTGYAALRTDCSGVPCLLIGGAQGPGGGSGWIERVEPETGAASPLATLPNASVLAIAAFEAGFIAGGSTAGNDWSVTASNLSGQAQWSLTVGSGHRLRGLALDRGGYVYAAGSGSSGADAMVALISPIGDLLGQSLFDDGVSEAFHGVRVGPEGLITAAGQRTDAGGNRFLLINLDAGKAH